MNILNKDTIVAMATSPGGAIGIVRLSGPQSLDIVSKLFAPARKSTIIDHSPGTTLHYGMFHSPNGDDIDEVMLSIFRAPHSYTGEDCAEISCHGSAFIMQTIMQACVQKGARYANRGEYTLRAYLNGKMDLSQAEAVADLIASNNNATHKLALSQLKGHFSKELLALRQQLLQLTTLLELELDFSDHEELEFASRTQLSTLANTILNHITTLAHSFKMGNALKQGVPVAIVGKTNVGKSTLLNQLLHEERAIVSAVAGTTRDVIEDTLVIRGVTFRLIDTAGIRHTTDEVERIGIERAYKKLNDAFIVLWVVDDVPSNDEIDLLAPYVEKKKVILVRNKADLQDFVQQSLASVPFFIHTEVVISAKDGTGIDKLEEELYHAADIPKIHEDTIIVTSMRHYEALVRAEESMRKVTDGLALNLSADLLAEDLRLSLDDLADITGGAITQNETLENVFKHFCIGK